MVISWLVVLIAVAGLVIYLASNGKPSQVGLVMLGCGLLAACLLLGGRSVHLP